MDLRKLGELVKDTPAWQDYIRRLHDEAGLEAHDDDLELIALYDLKAEITRAIKGLAASRDARRWVVSVWREEGAKKTTAATVA